MRYLLDTHAFLWLAFQSKLLSKKALECLEDPENQIFLSSISVWEMEQKYQIGKIDLPDTPYTLIQRLRSDFSLLPLPFDDSSAFQLHKLPLIHNDPFDRMLICQAIQHSLPIMTNDRFIREYPIKTVW